MVGLVPKAALKAVLLLGVPIVVAWSGGWVMERLVGREYVAHRLEQNAEEADREPLFRRFTGYDLTAVHCHWRAFDDCAFAVEQHFLQMDLLFPFLYGAALMSALLLAWSALGRLFQPVWIVMPVMVAAIADWIENLVQLAQLSRYRELGEAGLQAGWIKIASAATIIKLVSFVGAIIVLACLAGWIVLCAIRDHRRR